MRNDYSMNILKKLMCNNEVIYIYDMKLMILWNNE